MRAAEKEVHELEAVIRVEDGMLFSAKSDIGNIRKINEDSFGYYTDDGIGVSFFMVADGMGGHKAGEVASSIAVSSFLDAARDFLFDDPVIDQNSISAFLVKSIKEADRNIKIESDCNPQRSGMGTTAVIAVVYGESIYFANVGDSRAYTISESAKLQITIDHSYVEKLVEDGIINRTQARVHPRRNEITRALGFEGDSDCDIFTRNIMQGEKILLCSDGLNTMLEDEEMFDIVNKGSDSEDISKKLIEAAKNNGGDDNITVIVIIP